MTNLSELLSKLHDAATPRPWERYGMGGVTSPQTDVAPEFRADCGGCGEDAGIVVPLSPEDAELIVALRNHTPEIIAALEAVERVREDHRLVTLSPDFSITPHVWYGECSCHAPDGLGVGRADFYGATPQDVVDAQLDHAIRALDGASND